MERPCSEELNRPKPPLPQLPRGRGEPGFVGPHESSHACASSYRRWHARLRHSRLRHARLRQVGGEGLELEVDYIGVVER